MNYTIQLLLLFVQFWFTAECFFIGFFAFLGVAIRIFIVNCFLVKENKSLTIEYPNHNEYEIYTTIFILHPYMLPNCIGCFVIAVLYCYLARLTKFSLAFTKGLTIGFCGSLTTFSSWMFSSLSIPWTRENWYKIWIMIAIEFAIIWSFFMFGFYVVDFVEKHSKVIHRYIYIPIDMMGPSKRELVLSSDGMSSADVGIVAVGQQTQQVDHSEKIEQNEEKLNVNDSDQIEEEKIAKSIDIEMANEENNCRGKAALFV
jgi:fluoride ion exporter CrcB/FEX